MKPAPFRYARPQNLADAVELLAAADHDVKILAGGQSLVPMLNLRLVRPAVLIDLNGVPGLDHIAPGPAAGGLTIGALARHAALAHSVLVIERAPLLAEAARHIGHAAIRHRGTLGGSIAHADPAAELPAALIALGAELVLHGRRGARTIQASEFFLGLMTTALAADEILVEIRVPPQGPGWGFAEVVRRTGDFALAGVVALVGPATGSSRRGESARLVGFGVGDRPVRFAAAEEILTSPGADPRALVARAAEAAAEACDPPEDVHASADYRRHLAAVLTEAAVRQALARLDGAGPS